MKFNKFFSLNMDRISGKTFVVGFFLWGTGVKLIATIKCFGKNDSFQQFVSDEHAGSVLGSGRVQSPCC